MAPSKKAPSQENRQQEVKTIEDYTLRISRELKVCGVMNIQYAICQDKVYILEANPRASRTVPLVSKVCNVPMARIATQLMLGARLKDLDPERQWNLANSLSEYGNYPEG